jgi:EAL domain-containing protein (putative c-di-GMP-specific phosphodiesterase class I)
MKNTENELLSKSITAYFQPIIAIDTKKVYSYEVLGRSVEEDGTVKSLGHFFSSALSKDALKIDRIVRRRALEHYANEGGGEYLFINLRLDWIAEYANRPEELPTVQWTRELGIDMSRLVIEITEDEFLEDNEAFSRVMAFYKNMGCRIAIDDYGKNASHIDRLAALSPDIIKIDMSYIHRSEHSYHYREYLKSLTSFAERVGIEVLYEGIETAKQLDICMESQGRLYQGFLVAEPQASIKEAVINFDIFTASSMRMIKSQRDNSEHLNRWRGIWDSLLERFFSENKPVFEANGMNEYFSKLCLWLPDHVKRIYLCDRDGDQLSYNIEKCAGNITWNDYARKNWSWRSYFREAMVLLDTGIKSYLTDMYRDVTTKEEITTYICHVRTGIFLFIDILQQAETNNKADKT